MEWQVIPYGTTCSSYSATYALQRHVIDHSQPEDNVRHSLERCFYVDNCLQSVATPDEAKVLVNTLSNLLSEGGFDYAGCVSLILLGTKTALATVQIPQ